MAESAQPHKADVFAGKGSFADRLRQRRVAVESGDPSGGQQPPDDEAGEPAPEPTPAVQLSKVP